MRLTGDRDRNHWSPLRIRFAVEEVSDGMINLRLPIDRRVCGAPRPLFSQALVLLLFVC